MHFDWSTLALQTVNFTILVWLLHRFLYQPVLHLVDARRTELEEQYAKARSVEARAKDQLAAVEAREAGIIAERATALREAAAEAEQAATARRARQGGRTPRARSSATISSIDVPGAATTTR